MRQYQEGDDLRRIHWPSVARTGELMIRQDESSRRASGLVFLDNRGQALGQIAHPRVRASGLGAPPRSACCSRNGASPSAWRPRRRLRRRVSEERFLDALAGISHAQARSIGPSLAHLRAGASADTSLVFVSAPPAPGELASLIRAGAGFGPRLAVLVHPVDPQTLPPGRPRSSRDARPRPHLSFARAGWDCIVLTPATKLKDRWHAPKERPLARSV